jgi:hypothetical protein
MTPATGVPIASSLLRPECTRRVRGDYSAHRRDVEQIGNRTHLDQLFPERLKKEPAPKWGPVLLFDLSRTGLVLHNPRDSP